ncbi:DUF2577 family protein [Paenibacillus hamazuiensis]|uniref:DUF2577 family protein n=1 Tax=Paenibacillus hamazuiensis TaxID=2936508 RepID=UPI002010A7E2|nr:DUF2577 family protein [Paenibacillus hamazuiensis]
MAQLEGNGITKLTQVIKHVGYNDFDRIELATVTSLTPTLIRVDNMKIDLDAFDLVFAKHLTDRTLTVVNPDGTKTAMLVESPLQVGDRVIVASMNGGQTYVVLDIAVTL